MEYVGVSSINVWLGVNEKSLTWRFRRTVILHEEDKKRTIEKNVVEQFKNKWHS